MKTKTHLFFVLGVLAIILGMFVGLLELFATRALANHSVWYLEKFFGPGRSPEYSYEHLYKYAADLVESRNSQVCFYQSVLCGLLILLGLILLLWGRERRRGASRG